MVSVSLLFQLCEGLVVAEYTHTFQRRWDKVLAQLGNIFVHRREEWRVELQIGQQMQLLSG